METLEVLGGGEAGPLKAAVRPPEAIGISSGIWKTERWRKVSWVSKVRALNGTKGGMRWHELCACVRKNIWVSPICI